MNIFFLSWNPKKCAEWHCDKHCVKMILEYAQLLSTAHRCLDGEEIVVLSKNNRRLKRYILADHRESIMYKSTHKNHPCAIWVRESKENYTWLYTLFCSLCDEYTSRYNKIHATDTRLRTVLKDTPTNINKNNFMPYLHFSSDKGYQDGITTPPQAMPDEYKTDDTIEAYRIFYIYSKKRFATWKYDTPWFCRITHEGG